MHHQVRDAMYRAFAEVYEEGHYILGRHVEDFERAYAAYGRTTYCVGVSNGLDALRLALGVLGVGAGDEVIVPSNTYIATALAISHTGASVVFTEPDIRTYNIDPLRLEAAITARTKAIVPVHLYGLACDMEQVMSIAGRRGVFVVEDNAQAQGAAFRDKPTGAWGHINATSFFPTKNLGALGDAGALTTDDPVLASKVSTLRNYGSTRKYYNEVLGYNMRLDELQAAFLSVKLAYLDGWTSARRDIARRYSETLAGVGDICLPYTGEGATHVYHIYMIRTADRDDLRDYLAARDIGTLIHYPVPPYLQKAYAHLGFGKGDFPIAGTIADTCLSLPIWPGMEDRDIDVVCSAVKDFFSKKRQR
jgi:dTDP-4-amino-4,6-dideoxygalactose transaminase